LLPSYIKKRNLIGKKNECVEEKVTENGTKPNENVEKESELKSVPWGPQRKKRRLNGYKEDPYVFFYRK